jgi:hypothetical protein
MPNDFIISKLDGRWQIEATSERGKAAVADDPRFDAGKADLDPDQSLAAYQGLHSRGYFAGVPDGLPPPGKGLIVSRMALALALIVIPLVMFLLLT